MVFLRWISLLRLFTDRDMKPVDKATWWIEYVCRNGMDGGDILKPIFSDIPWYQHHHLDVILVLVGALCVLIGLIVSFIKCCIGIGCCCNRAKQKEE